MADETRWTSRKREFQAGAIFHRNPIHDPIDVLRGGSGKPFIYDGHHRAAAAKIRGQKTITANVRQYG